MTHQRTRLRTLLLLLALLGATVARAEAAAPQTGQPWSQMPLAARRVLSQPGDRALTGRGLPGDLQIREDAATGQAPALTPAPAAIAGVAQPDFLILAMMEQVTQGRLRHYLGGLTGEWPVIVAGQPYTITTRYTASGEPIDRATQYVAEHLSAQGLDVTYHSWQSAFYSGRNVIGELGRGEDPDGIFVVAAHLDDKPTLGLAPGADDNASGSTAVLVAADILSQYEWACTLRFALWTGEEQGLLGSQVYAREAAARDEKIAGVLNLDMIGYDSDEAPIADVHARSQIPGSVAMAKLFAGVVNAYGLMLQPNILIDDALGNYSDNKSFWDQGYAAILAIEDYDDFTPHYHSSADRLDTLNLAYMTEFTRAAVGTLVHMSDCLLTGELDGAVTTTRSAAPIPAATVTISHTSGSTLTSVTDASGTFTRTLATGTYTVTATAAGYRPATVGGVTVRDQAVTVRNLSLEPAFDYWLPLVTSDVSFS